MRFHNNKMNSESSTIPQWLLHNLPPPPPEPGWAANLISPPVPTQADLEQQEIARYYQRESQRSHDRQVFRTTYERENGMFSGPFPPVIWPKGGRMVYHVKNLEATPSSICGKMTWNTAFDIGGWLDIDDYYIVVGTSEATLSEVKSKNFFPVYINTSLLTDSGAKFTTDRPPATSKPAGTSFWSHETPWVIPRKFVPMNSKRNLLVAWACSEKQMEKLKEYIKSSADCSTCSDDSTTIVKLGPKVLSFLKKYNTMYLGGGGDDNEN